LKRIQREQREAFFADGKLEFSDLRRAIYGEIREEFRDRWGAYFEAQRDGADAVELAEIKRLLKAEQAERLADRRDEAYDELRASRKEIYRDLLDDQRDFRAGLRARQAEGLDNELFLRHAAERGHTPDMHENFAAAAKEATSRPNLEPWNVDSSAPTGTPREERTGFRSGADIGGDIATGLGFGLIALLDGFADALTGSTPARRPPPVSDEPRASDADAVFDETRRREQREREDADAEWRRRQQAHERE
jgi:hypothetical protein